MRIKRLFIIIISTIGVVAGALAIHKRRKKYL